MAGKKNKEQSGKSTLCVARSVFNRSAAHTEPIYATSAYVFEGVDDAMFKLADKEHGYQYSRWRNPNVDMAQEKIAALEGYGLGKKTYCQLFSSGMAAITAAILAVCESGDAVLTQPQLYGGTDELLHSLLPRYGISVLTVSMQDIHELDQVLTENERIKLVYLETPSNPLIELVDIAAVSKVCKRHKVKVAVDNTFSTPLVQQPLALGADLVMHSTTKFLNGHGTGLAGAVVGTDRDLIRRRVWLQIKLMGAVPGAFDAWLLTQGLKTLPLRMERHVKNAMKVAQFLEAHPKVERVFYAGLSSHPQARLRKRQMRSGGSMLSFELKGGIRAGKRLMGRVRLCQLVTSLGTVDTLIQHPASMTHVNVPAERRLASGITDGLVRLSVGIEDVQDIITDLERGLK